MLEVFVHFHHKVLRLLSDVVIAAVAGTDNLDVNSDELRESFCPELLTDIQVLETDLL